MDVLVFQWLPAYVVQVNSQFCFKCAGALVNGCKVNNWQYHYRDKTSWGQSTKLVASAVFYADRLLKLADTKQKRATWILSIKVNILYNFVKLPHKVHFRWNTTMRYQIKRTGPYFAHEISWLGLLYIKISNLNFNFKN